MLDQLVFKQSTGQQVLRASAAAVLLAIVIARNWTELDGTRWIAVLVAIMVFGLVLWDMSRVCLVANRSGLVIRNSLRTTRVPRSSIEGFRLGKPFALPNWRTVQVLTRSPHRVLNPTALLSFDWSREGQRRLEEAVARLNQWLANPTDR